MDKVVTYSFQEISATFCSLVISPHHALFLGKPDVVVVELQRGAALPSAMKSHQISKHWVVRGESLLLQYRFSIDRSLSGYQVFVICIDYMVLKI